MNTIFGSEARKPGRSRTAQWIEGILLITALVCIGWYGYNWIASEADQMWSSYQLDAQLAGQKPTVGGFLHGLIYGQPAPAPEQSTKAEAQVEEPAAAPQPKRRHVPTGENIGRIEIPRLHISAIVRQGVDDKTLGRAVGHVPYTALPGEDGNIGLAAHRDTYFRALRDVKEGDKIRLVTGDGTFEYQVESLKIVTPKNVEVLDPTPHPAMTLVTCYPFNFIGHAPKRFIVRAKQLGVEEAAAPVSTGAKHHESRRRSG